MTQDDMQDSYAVCAPHQIGLEEDTILRRVCIAIIRRTILPLGDLHIGRQPADDLIRLLGTAQPLIEKFLLLARLLPQRGLLGFLFLAGCLLCCLLLIFLGLHNLPRLMIVDSH